MPDRDEGTGLGSLLRAFRQRLDLTIERLSQASGVSERTISDIERGVSAAPQPRTVAALADALSLLPEERASFLATARAARVALTPTDRGLASRPNRAVDFSGRADERALLTSMLESSADVPTAPTAVVVTGPPGVGKTTLALECLHDVSEDGILFVDLQGFKVTALSPLQVLQALLRQASGRSAEFLTLDDASVAWRGLTSSSRTAVLLDNAASEAQVRPVLAATGLRVVVTSRRTLAGLEGARRITLGPLLREDSVAFLRRSIGEGQEVDGDLDEIARYCADLPLALRIAGARIASRPNWSVEDYAARLRLEDDRLRHLVAGDLNIESTFALSYTTLDAETQEFFRGLALLRGSSFGGTMASAIHDSDPGHGSDLLDELVDLGLVESLGGERYRLHDLLRIFAADRLRWEEADDSFAAKRNRLLHWILDTTASAGESYRRDERTYGASGYLPAPGARRWLLTESAYWADGIREAARLGRHEDVCRVVDALLDFSGRVAAGVDWSELMHLGIESAKIRGDSAVLVPLLYSLAGLQLNTLGEVERARATALEAVHVAQAMEDDGELGQAFVELARAEARAGNLEEARTFASQGRDLFHRRGEIDFEIRARTVIVGASMSDPEEVGAECRRILALLDSAEIWPITKVHALTDMARALLTIELWDDASLVSERFVAEAALFTDEPDFLARAYRHRGFAELGLGRVDRARADLEAAVGIARSYAPPWWTAEIDATLERLRST